MKMGSEKMISSGMFFLSSFVAIGFHLLSALIISSSDSACGNFSIFFHFFRSLLFILIQSRPFSVNLIIFLESNPSFYEVHNFFFVSTPVFLPIAQRSVSIRFYAQRQMSFSVSMHKGTSFPSLLGCSLFKSKNFVYPAISIGKSPKSKVNGRLVPVFRKYTSRIPYIFYFLWRCMRLWKIFRKN